MTGTNHLPRILMLSLALAALGAAGFAYAQNPETPARTIEQTGVAQEETFRARVMQIRAQTVASSTIAAPARTQRVATGVETRLRAAITNAQIRISRAITQIEGSADRIGVLVDTYAARGIDTAAAEILIADARVSLRSASAIVTDKLPAEVEAALTAEDPQAAFAFVKESLRTAASHVRSAQVSLRSALAELKAAE